MNNIIYLSRICVLPLVISILLGAPVSVAQSPTEILNAIESAISEERRQENIRREKERAAEKREKPSVGHEVEEMELLQEVDENCTPVSSVKVEGVSVIREKEIRRIVQSYENKCLTKTDMNNVMRELTNLYFKKGYITSRVYIPRDSFNDGEFRLVIVEGYVEAIKSPDGKERKYKNIFPTIKNSVFNIRDVEQGLDQMNRLGTVKAKSDIEPGREIGKSSLVIDEKSDWRLQGSLSIDNSGSEKTGVHMATLRFTNDNLLGIYDVATLSLKSNTDYARGEKENLDVSLTYDIPFGYSNFILSWGENKTTSIISGTVSDFQTENRNKNASIAWKKIWFRDSRMRYSTKLAWNRKSKGSYINGSEIQISTYTRQFGSLNMDFSNILESGVLKLGVGIDVGVDTEIDYDHLGVPIPLPDSFPDENYVKFSPSVDWQMPVSFMGQNSSLDLSVRGQYSKNNLFGEDLFQIGGAGTVQGFDTNNLAYKSGMNFRSKLTMSGIAKSLPFGSVPYIGLDFGHVFDPSSSFHDNSLSSFSAGFTSQLAFGISFGLDFGIALTYPEHFDRRDYTLDFRITKTF